MKLSRKTTIGIVLVVLFLAGISFFLFKDRLLQQGYQSPKVGKVVESIYGLGTITSSQIFNLRTSLPVVVEQLFVQEGDVIKAGAALGRFDQAILRTPIDGTVTAVNSELKELLNPQSLVMTVINLDKLFIEVSLEQQSVLRIKSGQKATISFESLRSEKYEGLVRSVYPRDNQFIVRVSMEAWPKNILPGMTADVAILVGEKSDVLLVPIKSIVAGEITRMRGDRKARVKVKLGILDGEWAELLEGDILPDDKILIRAR